MNTLFSSDQFSEDSSWPSQHRSPSPFPAMMNRSTSEWDLDRFLEEVSASQAIPRPPEKADSKSISPMASSTSTAPHQTLTSKREEGNVEIVENLEVKKPYCQFPPRIPPVEQSPTIAIDSYQFLKNQLHLACSAVALARASYPNSGDPAEQGDSRVQTSETSQPGLHTNGKGTAHGTSLMQSNGSPHGIPTLPEMPRKLVGGQTTSGSSRDDSDDDELEGDIDIDNMDPADAKRARRMLSNRESARRSRRRKQAQMNELGTQVSQLMAEYSTSLNRLTDMNQKYDDAAVDNRILKADIETLRAKVKMAEETVKRLTGINPLIVMANNPITRGMPDCNGQIAESTNASSSMQQNSKFFPRNVPNITNSNQPHQSLNGNLPCNQSLAPSPQSDFATNIMADMVSSVQPSGLGHVQNQIHSSTGLVTSFSDLYPEPSHAGIRSYKK